MGQTEPVPLHARPERPIEIAADDLLQRDTFVTRLTTALIDTNTGKATGIVVGITGAWGSGKSSVLNLVSLEVQRTAPQAVVVRFDPWLVSGRNDLIG
jgi:predicted KAP-like P-loop ATPase